MVFRAVYPSVREGVLTSLDSQTLSGIALLQKYKSEILKTLQREPHLLSSQRLACLYHGGRKILKKGGREKGALTTRFTELVEHSKFPSKGVGVAPCPPKTLSL